MNDEEKYLFDLQGYLVLEDVMSAEELAVVNDQLDGHRTWEGENPLGFQFVKRYNDFLINAGYLHSSERPMRSLIAHPRVLPYLEALLGDGFRYDEGQALFARPGVGALILHNGGTPWDPVLGYQVRDGHIHAGHLVAAFCLTDATEAQGGFAAIPGSHKSAFPCPPDFRRWKTVGPWVKRVPVKAGSVILFADTVTHGSWPWEADFERRVVFCRYTPGMVQHGAPAPVADETPFDDWSPLERRLLRRPHEWHFGVAEDGYTETQRSSVIAADGYVMKDHSHQIVPVAQDERSDAHT